MAYLRSQKSTMNRVRLYYLKRREIIWLGMMTQSRNFLIRNNGSLGLYQRDVKGQKSPQNVICILKKKNWHYCWIWNKATDTVIYCLSFFFFSWRHVTKYWTWWWCEKHFVQFIFHVFFFNSLGSKLEPRIFLFRYLLFLSFAMK